jgi:hypothetical protein
MTKIILTAASALVMSAGAAFDAGGDHFPVYESGATTVVNQEALIDHGTAASISDVQQENVQAQEPEVRKWGR